MQWYKFYGKTAEKFYFHPPGRDPVPIGRPPQFDYIYRANETAKARAKEEVNKLRGKSAALMDRRRRLEAEQAELWCEIAFHAVAHHDLHKRPLYRFEPLVGGDDADAKQHAEVVKPAALFMRLALSIIDLAQEDQAATFSKIKIAVANAREAFDDSWLRQGVDASDKKTTEGKFAALAKRLDEMASNLSESYLVAVEGAREQDQQRKDTFRGLLQESLVNYAEIILALDELAVAMRDEQHIKPNPDRPIPAFTLANLDSAMPTQSDDIGATAKAKIGEEDSRVRWLNESYNASVRFVQAKKAWEEVDKAGRVMYVDKEVARTADYVEVYSPERKLEIRLRADKMEQKKNGQWSWVANGRWEGTQKAAKEAGVKADKRTRWINESYHTTVSRTGDKKWADVHDQTGDVWNTYVETARTDDYIEVYCARTKDTIRYFSDKAEFRKGNASWQWVAKGHWDAAAD